MNPKFVRYLTDRRPTVIRSPREALMTARINTPGSPKSIGLLGALPTSRHLRPIKKFSIEEAMTFSISENPRHAFFFFLYSWTFLIVCFWLYPHINFCIQSSLTYTENFDWLLRPREYKPLITTSNIEMIRSCKYATPRGFVRSTRWRDTWEGFFPKIDLEYSIKGVVQAKKCFDPLHHQPLVMVSSVLVGIFIKPLVRCGAGAQERTFLCATRRPTRSTRKKLQFDP